MIERLIPRQSPSHLPSSLLYNAGFTYLSSNKMSCLALFWAPVLKTWLLATLKSSLPITISPCFLSSVSAWSRLSFHIHFLYSRDLGSVLYSSYSWHTQRKAVVLCLWLPSTSYWQLLHCLLSLLNLTLSSAPLFFKSLLWYIVFDTLEAATRLCLCVYVCLLSQKSTKIGFVFPYLSWSQQTYPPLF